MRRRIEKIAKSEEDVAAIVHEEFGRRFGPDEIGPKDGEYEN
jgi:hypothetical protein